MITEVFKFFLPFLAIFLIVIGLWAIGQWLRRKGYGEQLDKIDARMSAVQDKIRWFLRPLGGGMISVGRGLSRVPLLGSRQSRDMWDNLEALLKHQEELLKQQRKNNHD